MLSSTHLDVSYDDAVTVGVEEILALWIAAQHDRLSSLRARQRRVYVL